MENKTNLKFNIMAIVLIVLFAISITPVSFQNDTFYSIKIGEYITEKGITMEDPFSWHENLPYTYPHWAYDVGTYLVYKVRRILGNIYSNCSFSCNFRNIGLLYACFINQKQFNFVLADIRCIVLYARLHCCKSTARHIYSIYINGVFN